METVFRRGLPNQFDQLPYRTRFHCPTEEGAASTDRSFDIWVQSSQDEYNPVWKRVGCYENLYDPTINKEIDILLADKEK